jgi:hypothetical protein
MRTIQLAAVFVATVAGQVQADLIFSQIDSTSSGSGYTAGGGWEVGDDFTLTQNATLDLIEWASSYGGGGTTRFRLYETGVGDFPQSSAFYDVNAETTIVGSVSGALLKSLTLPGGGIALTTGTRYWWTVEGAVGVFPGVHGYSNGSGGGTPSTLALSNDDGASWLNFGGTTYFELSGTVAPSASAVPEPSTFTLGMTAIGLYGYRRRKRRQA